MLDHDPIVVVHFLDSSLRAESRGPRTGRLFLKARPGKKNTAGWPGMMRRPFLDTYSGWRDRDAMLSRSCMS